MQLGELLKCDLERYRAERVSRVKSEIESSLQCLTDCNMNLNAVADPSTAAIAVADEWHPLHERSLMRLFILSFIDGGKSVLHANNVFIVAVDQHKIERIIRAAGFHATKESRDFLYKLEEKLRKELKGDVVAFAKVDGDLWRNSCLEAVTKSGRIATFNTRVVLNRSKFGDWYVQFRTRVQWKMPEDVC